MGVMLALAAVGGLVLLALSTREDDDEEQSGDGVIPGGANGAGGSNANLRLLPGMEPLLPAVAQYLATATDPTQIESFAATLAPSFPTTAEMLRQRAAQIRAAAAAATAAIPSAPAYGAPPMQPLMPPMPPIPIPSIPSIPIPPMPPIPIPTIPNVAPSAPSQPSPTPTTPSIPGVPPAIDPAILARIQDILGAGAPPSGAAQPAPTTPTLDPSTWGLQVPAPSPAPGQSPSPLRPGDVPPIPTFDEAEARRLASRVGTNLRQRGRRYDHALMRQFQRAAGLTADGLYGGSTRGALLYFGVRNPPAAYVRSASHGRETVTYQPPNQAAA